MIQRKTLTDRWNRIAVLHLQRQARNERKGYLISQAEAKKGRVTTATAMVDLIVTHIDFPTSKWVAVSVKLPLPAKRHKAIATRLG